MVYYSLEEIVGVKIQDFWKMVATLQKPLFYTSKMQIDLLLQNVVFYTLDTKLRKSSRFPKPLLYRRLLVADVN